MKNNNRELKLMSSKAKIIMDLIKEMDKTASWEFQKMVIFTTIINFLCNSLFQKEQGEK